MKRRLQSIISKLPALGAFALILVIWQLLCSFQVLPSFMLPSPGEVVGAFWTDRSLLWENSRITLLEAFYGLVLGIPIGFLFAVLMDACPLFHKMFYPLVVVSQTIPTVAIAPLLVLWFGYEMTPKVILIVLITFFPVTMGLLGGFQMADPDAIHLLQSMGAGRLQIFWHIKCPYALGSFFSGLKIAAAYSIVGAVISEWLGGFGGLGVYMTRVKKGFAFDKMFAVIILISVISLLLMWLVNVTEKLCMPYRKYTKIEKV